MLDFQPLGSAPLCETYRVFDFALAGAVVASTDGALQQGLGYQFSGTSIMSRGGAMDIIVHHFKYDADVALSNSWIKQVDPIATWTPQSPGLNTWTPEDVT